MCWHPIQGSGMRVAVAVTTRTTVPTWLASSSRAWSSWPDSPSSSWPGSTCTAWAACIDPNFMPQPFLPHHHPHCQLTPHLRPWLSRRKIHSVIRVTVSRRRRQEAKNLSLTPATPSRLPHLLTHRLAILVLRMTPNPMVKFVPQLRGWQDLHLLLLLPRPLLRQSRFRKCLSSLPNETSITHNPVGIHLFHPCLFFFLIFQWFVSVVQKWHLSFYLIVTWSQNNLPIPVIRVDGGRKTMENCWSRDAHESCFPLMPPDRHRPFSHSSSSTSSSVFCLFQLMFTIYPFNPIHCNQLNLVSFTAQVLFSFSFIRTCIQSFFFFFDS